MGMSSSSWKLLVASSVLTLLSLFLHLFAFGSREWLVAGSNSPFRSIGLFEACFYRCRDPYCRTNGQPAEMYDGCRNIYDFYFHEIKDWLRPGWFVDVRNMSAALVPMLILSAILTVVCARLLFGSCDTTDYSGTRRLVEVLLLFITFVLLFVSGLLGFAGIATFSVHAFDAEWMPISDKNHFGYSFWMEVCSALLATCACVTSLVAAIFKILKKNSLKERSYSQEFNLGGRY